MIYLSLNAMEKEKFFNTLHKKNGKWKMYKKRDSFKLSSFMFLEVYEMIAM